MTKLQKSTISNANVEQATGLKYNYELRNTSSV
jgi:hypothetical protein